MSAAGLRASPTGAAGCRDRVVLDGAEGRHAATVRRLARRRARRAGRRARSPRRPAQCPRCAARTWLELDVASVVDEPAPQPRLVVVQALAKGDRGEHAVETMTEVGVDEIVPWAAARCVTRWRERRGEKALARWRTTAQAAAKQSRRARFPVVAELAGTRDVVDRLRRAAAGVVLHEEADDAAGAAVQPPAAGEVVAGRRPRGRAQRRGAGRPSRPPAPRRTASGRPCCAPRPPAPPPWPPCSPAPPAGADPPATRR